MTDRTWIGIDLGTQSLRVVAVADDGRVLAQASRPLTSIRAGTRHEQDPREWWEAASACLSEVTAALGNPSSISAIAVSGTSGTVCVVDGEGIPTTPGIMYDDTRASAFTNLVNAVGAETWTRLGYRMQSSWALPAILWMRKAGMLDGRVYVAHQPDVITARLAGRRVPSDSSHALKSGIDLETLQWPTEIMAELGIPLSAFPEVRESGQRIGVVGLSGAAETGLPAGCAIIAGMTDGCAAQLAAGALHPGSWNSVLGTTLVVKGVSATRMPDPTGAIYSHRAPFGMGWLPGGASSTGAGAMAHWLPGRDLDALTRAASSRSAVAVAYPLVGGGERFPFVAARATAFFGAETGPPEDDVDAFAEIAYGVAFVERLSYDLLAWCGYDTTGALSLTGGGSRNHWWNQARCDVLARSVTVPAESEGAIGMAMLASAALDHATAPISRLSVAATRMLSDSTVLEPSGIPEIGARYRRFVAKLHDRGWIGDQLASVASERS